jgi:hypothetical protein
MTDSRIVRWSVRVYEKLILAYPAEFRKKYGGEMIDIFREIAADAWQRRGTVGLLAIGFRVLLDLARTVPQEHFAKSKSREGELPMSMKTLMLRKLGSDAVVARWAQYAVYAISLLMLAIFLGKFSGMKLAPCELFFGVLVTVSMTLQGIAYGLLLPLFEQYESSSLKKSAIQIVLYAVAVLTMIFGVLSLQWFVQSEYQLFLGILLLFELLLTVMLIAGILLLVQALRARKSEKSPEKSLAIPPADAAP